MTESNQQVTLQHNALRDAPIISGSFIAGGALTSAYTRKPIVDYDYYFKSREHLEDAIRNAYDDSMWCLCVTDRAITFTDSTNILQFMVFDFFQEAEDIFDCFDFTCCMAAADCDSGEIIMHDHFMCALAARRLTFNENTKFPIASAGRVHKYQEKGFSIGRGDLMKIGMACARLNISSWGELLNQLGGIYGDQIKLCIDEGQQFSWDAAWGAISGAEFIPNDGKFTAPADAEAMIELVFSEDPDWYGEEIIMRSDLVDITNNSSGDYFMIDRNSGSKINLGDGDQTMELSLLMQQIGE